MANGVSLDPFQRIVNVGWAKNLFGVYVHVGTGNNVVNPNGTVSINTPFGPRTLVDGFGEAAGVDAPHTIVGSDLADFFAINRIFIGDTHFNSSVQVVALCGFNGLASFDLTVDAVTHAGLTTIDFVVFTTKSSLVNRLTVDLQGNAEGNPIPTISTIRQDPAEGSFNFHIDAATLDIS